MKTKILESLINFREGLNVVFNPDYDDPDFFIDNETKTKRGKIDCVDYLTGYIVVRFGNRANVEYKKIKYKYLKIIK